MGTAAIYARISRDDKGEEAGVTRQQEDCRLLAEQLHLTVAAVFVDNDRGASTLSKKDRPQFRDMMRRAEAGEFDAILAYTSSRLTRRPMESEQIIRLVETKGVRLHTVKSGSFDLTTADGRAVARTLAAWDAAEAERTGERVKRAFEGRARAGKSHGRVAYGWTRDADGAEHLDPGPAAVVSEAAQRILAGESMRAIAMDLNERKIPAPRGGEWNGVMLKQVLRRERNCGRAVHQGKVIGRGAWPPILSEDVHDAVVARTSGREARVSRGTELKYLLTGIMLCGKCGAAMRVVAGARSKANPEDRYPNAYACPGCFGVRCRYDLVEMVIETLVRRRLEMPDAPLLFSGDADGAREAMEERDGLKARLDRAADDYADGKITADQLERISGRIMPQLDAANARIAALGPNHGLEEFDGRVSPAMAWDKAPVRQRREVVNALMEVTLLPSGAGEPFSPERLKVAWKGNKKAPTPKH